MVCLPCLRMVPLQDLLNATISSILLSLSNCFSALQVDLFLAPKRSNVFFCFSMYNGNSLLILTDPMSSSCFELPNTPQLCLNAFFCSENHAANKLQTLFSFANRFWKTCSFALHIVRGSQEVQITPVYQNILTLACS